MALFYPNIKVAKPYSNFGELLRKFGKQTDGRSQKAKNKEKNFGEKSMTGKRNP